LFLKLFYYVFREYIKYVFGTVMLALFMFVLFDLIHKSGKYIPDYNPSFDHLVQLYLFQVPMLINQALPIASLLASVICMVLLGRTNEITAMRAAGMGPMSIGAPIAVGALCLSFFALFIGEKVVPIAAAKMHHVKEVLIEGEADSLINEGARWHRDGNRLINFREYDPVTKSMSSIRIIEISDHKFVPKRTTEISTADYQPITGDWKLKGIKDLVFGPSGDLLSVERRDEVLVRLPLDPSKLKKERRKYSEMSMKELDEHIQRGKASGADITSQTVEYHTKLAFPFAAFVVSLIGLKFAYRSERSMETARSMLFAIVIGMSYWMILSAGKAISKQGSVFPPYLGAWSANIVIFGIGVFEMIRLSRTKG
jgi:lipopolysaccharide export system permease protein